uniref:Uncharacterized protein n=1 Tax=Zea mays TaxID=4577 RepID=C4J3Q7_MAIZE|nr:unknown [Zea mays]
MSDCRLTRLPMVLGSFSRWPQRRPRYLKWIMEPISFGSLLSSSPWMSMTRRNLEAWRKLRSLVRMKLLDLTRRPSTRSQMMERSLGSALLSWTYLSVVELRTARRRTVAGASTSVLSWLSMKLASCASSCANACSRSCTTTVSTAPKSSLSTSCTMHREMSSLRYPCPTSSMVLPRRGRTNPSATHRRTRRCASTGVLSRIAARYRKHDLRWCGRSSKARDMIRGQLLLLPPLPPLCCSRAGGASCAITSSHSAGSSLDRRIPARTTIDSGRPRVIRNTSW